MKKPCLLILMFIIASSLIGCASMDQLRRGLNAVDSFWGETNEKYLSKYGERTYSIDINTAVSAMHKAINDISDLSLDDEHRISKTESYIIYKGIVSTILSKEEFKKLKKVEEPMMQAIAANEVGDFTSHFLVLTHGDNFNIIVKITFKELDTNFSISKNLRPNTHIKFNFKMYPNKEDKHGLYGENPPPEGVKIALVKVWNSFDDQIKNITGNEAVQVNHDNDRQATNDQI